MRLHFEPVAEDVYRLCVPFENIYTAVFAVVSPNTCCLIDSASSDEDVETYLLPALEERGWAPDWLLLSHLHGDHAGGLSALRRAFPKAKIGMAGAGFSEEHPDWEIAVLRDGQRIGERLQVRSLPGHAGEALGFLDLPSGTLLSCDCLQLYGVGRYGTGLSDPAAYLQTLQRLEAANIENIVASHEFVPLGSVARGREQVREYLKVCREAALFLQAFAERHQNLSAAALAALYNKTCPQLPPAQESTMQSIRGN